MFGGNCFQPIPLWAVPEPSAGQPVWMKPAQVAALVALGNVNVHPKASSVLAPYAPSPSASMLKLSVAPARSRLTIQQPRAAVDARPGKPASAKGPPCGGATTGVVQVGFHDW